MTRFKKQLLLGTALFMTLACLLVPAAVLSQEEPAQTKTAQTEKIFPGLNEVVPQATSVAAKVTEANVRVLNKSETQDTVTETMVALAKRLKDLEEQYSNWKEINTWQYNRLRSAQSRYTDLGAEYTVQLDTIYNHLQVLENLRITWGNEKTYWQEWQGVLNKTQVKAADETFVHTLTGINKLLGQITRVGDGLVKAQQKYSPKQEIIASRLSLIDKTLDNLRRGTFRKNTLSIFQPDYFNQFNRKLFTDFTSSLTTNSGMPMTYVKRNSLAFGLLVVSILIIALLLIYRGKQSKPITEEWGFLFRRPIAGAILISLIVMGNFTNMFRIMPFGWSWVMTIILAVVAIRLINVFYKQPLEKKVYSIIAVIIIITESLQYFGLPTPLLQLYHGLLCAAVIPFCWRFIHKRHEEIPGLHLLVYLIFGIAIVGLTSTMLGFERFATKLIDATLSTVIVLVLLRIALRLVDGGIQTFMQTERIRNRQFMQVLGLQEGTEKLQILSKIIILYNAALALLVIWMVFDNPTEASNTILNYTYKFGEFTFSVKMVVLVIIVLYLTTVFSWVIQAFAESQIMAPRKMDRGIKESLKRLIHYGLFTIGFFIAVSMAGLDLQKFTILAGALGVGIGFGLQNIVNNFVSGLILLFERPVKVGDIINIDQDWGTITRIGLRSTVVETFDRSEVIVPNGDLIAQKVTNWTFSSKMVRVNLPVGVEYGSPLEKVLEILNKSASEHPEVLPYPAPDSVFEGFGNSSIDFKLRFWVHTIDERLRIRTEVAVIIDRLFREEGIVIAFPQQDLHLRSIDSDLQPLFGAKSPETDSGGTSG